MQNRKQEAHHSHVCQACINANVGRSVGIKLKTIKIKYMENITMVQSGLKCDNQKCDWIDKSIDFDNYKEWINKPCPKCGENLLTEEDYFNAEAVKFAVDLINKLSPKQIAEISKSVDFEKLKNDPVFSSAIGLDSLTDESKISMSVDTHKEIRVTEIKPCD